MRFRFCRVQMSVVSKGLGVSRLRLSGFRVQGL